MLIGDLVEFTSREDFWVDIWEPGDSPEIIGNIPIGEIGLILKEMPDDFSRVRVKDYKYYKVLTKEKVGCVFQIYLRKLNL